MDLHELYLDHIKCKYRQKDVCMCELFLRKMYGLEPLIEGPQKMGQNNVCSLDEKIVGGQV